MAAIPEIKHPIHNKHDAQQVLSMVCDMVEVSTQLHATTLGQPHKSLRGVTNLALLILGMNLTLKHPEYVHQITKMTQMYETPTHINMMEAIMEYFPMEVHGGESS